MKEIKDQLRPECESFDIDTITLSRGQHFEDIGEYCAVELANKAASCIPELRAKYGGADFDDDHPSISPVIRAFVMELNDKLPDEVRTRLLKPFVLKILGTNTTWEDEWTRGWLVIDWLYRTCAPILLRAVDCIKEAEALETLPAVVDTTTAENAVTTGNATRNATRYTTWYTIQKAWREGRTNTAARKAGKVLDDARHISAMAIRRKRSLLSEEYSGWPVKTFIAYGTDWFPDALTSEEAQYAVGELLDKMCAVGRV